jgi:hypothetical protein
MAVLKKVRASLVSPLSLAMAVLFLGLCVNTPTKAQTQKPAQPMVMGPVVKENVTKSVTGLMKDMGAKPEMAEMMGKKYADSFKTLYDKMGRGEKMSDVEMAAIAGMMSTMASRQAVAAAQK